MKNHQDGQQYLKDIAHNFVPSNCRSYKFNVYTGKLGQNALGFDVDAKPTEGKVVAMNDDWIILKTARTKFFVCDLDLLKVIPNLNDTILLSPYGRKDFNGDRLDKPVEKKEDGFTVRTLKIGGQLSEFPVDKESLKSEYLRDLLTQIENLKAPDKVRTMAQVMIDAGARVDNITYNDPLDKDAVNNPPAVSFKVNTATHQGTLKISYNRASDYYDLERINNDGTLNKKVTDIDFTSLAEVATDLVDDGSWKDIQVETIKRAVKKRVSP